MTGSRDDHMSTLHSHHGLTVCIYANWFRKRLTHSDSSLIWFMYYSCFGREFHEFNLQKVKKGENLERYEIGTSAPLTVVRSTRIEHIRNSRMHTLHQEIVAHMIPHRFNNYTSLWLDSPQKHGVYSDWNCLFPDSVTKPKTILIQPNKDTITTKYTGVMSSIRPPSLKITRKRTENGYKAKYRGFVNMHTGFQMANITRNLGARSRTDSRIRGVVGLRGLQPILQGEPQRKWLPKHPR
jgi:hypothetical protein